MLCKYLSNPTRNWICIATAREQQARISFFLASGFMYVNKRIICHQSANERNTNIVLLQYR